MKSKWLVIILSLLAPAFLIGQYSSTVHYTVRDGLPSSTIYSAVEDSMGFMWMGTEAGLVRFDGAKFKVYTTLDGLPDNEVLGLLFDSVTSRLWIITYSKAACYYRHGKIYTAFNDSSLKAITCEYGEFISGNVQPGFGVFLYNGASIFECAHDKITQIKMKEAPVFQVKKWNNSTLDVLSDTGAIGYPIGHERVRYNEFDRNPRYNKGKWIDSMLYRFMPGHVISYQKTGAGIYQRKADISLDDNAHLPTDIVVFRGKLLICIALVGIYTAENSADISGEKIWSGNINAMYVDKTGNLWILTNDDGIYVINNAGLTNYTTENGFLHDNVTALFLKQDSLLYIGNTHGELFTLQNGMITHLDGAYTDKQEKVRAITSYDNSLFFITNTRVSHFDVSDQKNITVPHTAGGPKTILKPKDGKTILAGLLASIVEFDIHTGHSREIDTYKRIIGMAQHPDGRIFCGSLDGIYTYQGDTLSHVLSGDPRLSGRVTTLCFTPDSLLWVGTPSSGIFAYDGHRVVAHVSQVEYMGYHGAICRKITLGRANEIWVATNYGVNKINYHIHDSVVIDNIVPFSMADGLLSDDVNDILVHDSLVYVATSHGLTVLNENQMISAASVPIYISSIRINDKDSAIHEGEYGLAYWQNNLRIEYIGVTLPSAGYLRYQYRLLGSGSDKWETTTNTSIEFRSLSAGTYTFEAVVMDKFGNKSKSIARVRFEITPAFYTTVWFWAIIVIVILAIGFYIIRDRFLRQQRQYQKEQSLNNKIIELEQQALKAQMNPHFIFNCLTAIQHFVNREDLYSANMYLSNFAKLIRKTLDLSGEQYISLDKEVAYLQNYVQLEKMRFQEKFQYTIDVDDDIDQYSVQIPPMLLQPIIENAIRHGLRNKQTNTGLLKVDFTQSGDKIICTIDDNGVGMKKAKELKTTMHVEYQSKGMSLTQSRIQAINMISDKKITIDIKDKYDNNEATGTLFILTFEQ